MKSLLSTYFNRQQAIDETTPTSAISSPTSASPTTLSVKNIIKEQNQIDMSSFSSLASSSLTTSTMSSLTDQLNLPHKHTDSSLNIKYIDDVDTDGCACYSSTDDETSASATVKKQDRRPGSPSNNNLMDIKRLIATQYKANETVITTLERINENFEFLFEDCHEQQIKSILQSKQKNISSLKQLKEWLFLIKRVSKEAQETNKKIMDNAASGTASENQDEIIRHSKSQTVELEISNKNLLQQIKDLTEKLNTLETVNISQKEELDRTKDICESMRSDRKRLKSEKIELLSQAKELYNTIESKENELRDFLRHYESKTKETSFAVKKLIDTKAMVEQEKIDLQTRVFELLEEKNELKLVVESKNATITKLQKQLFEMNTKSIRHSLSKESDYGYVSTKASRDTLSTSLIESLKLNEYENTHKPTKPILRNKEDRNIKCKSNDYQQILKNKLKNKSEQHFENKETKSRSSSSNQSIIDYESDLNKVLDSEAFIDLDTSSSEKVDIKSNRQETKSISQFYSTDCIASTSSNHFKSPNKGMSLNKIDEVINQINEETSSCLSSVVSFSKSASNASSSTSVSQTNSASSSTSSSTSDSKTGSSESSSTTSSSSSSSTSPSSLTSSESSAMPSGMSQYISTDKDKLLETVPTLRRDLPNKIMSTSVTAEPKANKFSNQQSRSSRILNSLIKMSTTAAAVGSTGSSVNLEPSMASKVPLFTTTLSSSKIKHTQKAFNTSMNSNRTTYPAAKSLYSIFDLKSTSNGNLFSQNMTESNQEIANGTTSGSGQLSCNGLKNITMSCLKIDSLDKVNNVNEWSTDRVRNWLDQIGMQPSQIKNALKFIKNGKSLVNLSDSELERIFLIGNALHKRKLRLAIDELKSPEKNKYPRINELDNDWVCNTWLREIGLVQFKSIFRLNLIDGRVLNSLQKKDLEKYLSIHKKNIQTTLLVAIDFLRKHDFDIEKIEFMRSNYTSNGLPNDTSLWANDHFNDWLKLVNLQAFAKNLSESGIHGALIHDNIFTVDFLYQSLKVTDEPRYFNMKKILEDEIKLLRKPRSDSKDPNAIFARSASTLKADKPKIFTLRGSLGRALGKKIKRDISSPLVDDDTYRRIEFSHKIIDMKNFSTTSVV